MTKNKSRDLVLVVLLSVKFRDFSGDFSCKKPHTKYTQSLKPGQNTASTIHCLSQLQSTYAATVTGFAATQICLCIQAFLRSKDRESSLNQWPHNRLRETFTHFPIWDSYWDAIPMGDPRRLSKQGSGPAYHLSQQILACFGAILK